MVFNMAMKFKSSTAVDAVNQVAEHPGPDVDEYYERTDGKLRGYIVGMAI